MSAENVSSSELPNETLPKQLKQSISGPLSDTTDFLARSSDSEKNISDTDKKLVKLSVLSPKERLELRAKKFGSTIATDSIKIARSERFDTNKTTNIDNRTTIKTDDVATVDILKKRAERFGGSVSKVMNKIENLEKLQKRQERFGKGTSTNKVSVASVDEFAEKAKLRLERFKTGVK